jgi:hypothetical protein
MPLEILAEWQEPVNLRLTRSGKLIVREDENRWLESYTQTIRPSSVLNEKPQGAVECYSLSQAPKAFRSTDLQSGCRNLLQNNSSAFSIELIEVFE